MPQNPTNGATGNSVLVHNVLDDLVKEVGPLLSMQVNFGDQLPNGLTTTTARPGMTVNITDYSTAFTVQTKAAGADYTIPDYEAKAAVSVTLPNETLYVGMYITPEEYRILTGAVAREQAGSAWDALRTKARQMMGQGLADHLVGLYFATITAANHPANTVSAAGTFTRAKDRAIDKALFDRKIKSRGGIGILTSTAYDEYIGDHQIIQNNTGVDQSGLVLSGGFKSVSTGITYYRTQYDLPADAARGFVSTPTATLFVARAPDEATYENDSVYTEQLVHPSGFPMLSRVWKDPNSGNLKWVLATIPKFQKLQAEALQRVTAA